MIINEASQTVIVGFLCEYNNISDFQNLSWVKLTGTIKKGNLNGDIPILEITNIEKLLNQRTNLFILLKTHMFQLVTFINLPL